MWLLGDKTKIAGAIYTGEFDTKEDILDMLLVMVDRETSLVWRVRQTSKGLMFVELYDLNFPTDKAALDSFTSSIMDFNAGFDNEALNVASALHDNLTSYRQLHSFIYYSVLGYDDTAGDMAVYRGMFKGWLEEAIRQSRPLRKAKVIPEFTPNSLVSG